LLETVLTLVFWAEVGPAPPAVTTEDTWLLMSAVVSELPVTVALPVLAHVPCRPVGLPVPGHAVTAEDALAADGAASGVGVVAAAAGAVGLDAAVVVPVGCVAA
jgi:hypothetical protein